MGVPESLSESERPIVARIGSLNERLSRWVDHQLQPLVMGLPEYLTNAKQFLKKFKDFWKDEYVWGMCDITSLIFLAIKKVL